MDSDVSHAVQEQLDTLSARIDALENPTEVNPEPEPEPEPTPTPEPDIYAAVSETSSRSSRSKT